MRLVLVATSGNQGYIFASNRLREAVGASFLVACSTTDWLRRACQVVGGVLLQASSGSALVAVSDEVAARRLAQVVTLRVLREAPGLAVRAVSVPMAAGVPTAGEVQEVFAEWQAHAARVPSVSARHQRLPVVAACRSTERPAASWHSDVGLRRGSDGGQPVPLSAEVLAKRRARPAAAERMESLVGGVRLVRIDEFFESVEWVGVVHADGNQLGRLFREAGDLLTGDGGGVVALGRLSDEVRELSEAALRAAVAEVAPRGGGRLPLVPLVVGGDDLTVLVDGELALRFAAAYLKAFGAPAVDGSVLRRVLGARPGLTACAGMALVKPHFPFSVAYRVADELCRGAKSVASDHPGCHGLDAHVVLDSQPESVTEVRRRGYQTPHGVLTERPYLLAAHEGVSVPADRDWEVALERLEMVRELPVGGEGVAVTRTQLYALREELRVDPARACRRVAQLRRLAVSDEDRERLRVLGVGEDPDGGLPSGLHDVLELAPFAGGAL